MKVYFGLTNHSQLKRLPRDLDIMVSARMLMKMRTSSIAYKYISEFRSVMLDSGAFGSAFWDGGYTYEPDDYLKIVEKVMPDWWVTMDYPCEPNILPQVSIRERIHRTIENTKLLRTAPFPGFLAVIQGWEIEDYHYCVNRMEAEGLIMPVMGIGSICRRGSQAKVVSIIAELARLLPRVKFHAFGAKINTLNYNNGEILNYLDSLDTAAWQFNEKDELGGWQPRSHQEISRRLIGYRDKLNRRLSSPYQISLTKCAPISQELLK